MKHRTVASVLMGAALALMVFIGFSSSVAHADVNDAWWDGNPAAPPGSGNPSPNPMPVDQWRTPLDLDFTNTGSVAREYRVVVVDATSFKAWAKWHGRHGWANAGQRLTRSRVLTQRTLAPGASATFTKSVGNHTRAFIVVQSRDATGYWPDYYSWGNHNPWKNHGFTRLVRGDDTPITRTIDVAGTSSPTPTAQVPLTFGNQLAGTKFTAIMLTYPSTGVSRTANFTTPIVPGTSLVFDLGVAKDAAGNNLLIRNVPFTVKWANATDATTAPGQIFTFESNVTNHVAELFTVNAAGEMRDHNNLQINSLIPGAPAAAAKMAGTSTGTFSSGSFSQ